MTTQTITVNGVTFTSFDQIAKYINSHPSGSPERLTGRIAAEKAIAAWSIGQ